MKKEYRDFKFGNSDKQEDGCSSTFVDPTLVSVVGEENEQKKQKSPEKAGKKGQEETLYPLPSLPRVLQTPN